jgi:hypothetical protein
MLSVNIISFMTLGYNINMHNFLIEEISFLMLLNGFGGFGWGGDSSLNL